MAQRSENSAVQVQPFVHNGCFALDNVPDRSRLDIETDLQLEMVAHPDDTSRYLVKTKSHTDGKPRQVRVSYEGQLLKNGVFQMMNEQQQQQEQASERYFIEMTVDRINEDQFGMTFHIEEGKEQMLTFVVYTKHTDEYQVLERGTFTIPDSPPNMSDDGRGSVAVRRVVTFTHSPPRGDTGEPLVVALHGAGESVFIQDRIPYSADETEEAKRRGQWSYESLMETQTGFPKEAFKLITPDMDDKGDFGRAIKREIGGLLVPVTYTQRPPHHDVNGEYLLENFVFPPDADMSLSKFRIHGISFTKISGDASGKYIWNDGLRSGAATLKIEGVNTADRQLIEAIEAQKTINDQRLNRAKITHFLGIEVPRGQLYDNLLEKQAQLFDSGVLQGHKPPLHMTLGVLGADRDCLNVVQRGMMAAVSENKDLFDEIVNAEFEVADVRFFVGPNNAIATVQDSAAKLLQRARNVFDEKFAALHLRTEYRPNWTPHISLGRADGQKLRQHCSDQKKSRTVRKDYVDERGISFGQLKLNTIHVSEIGPAPTSDGYFAKLFEVGLR